MKACSFKSDNISKPGKRKSTMGVESNAEAKSFLTMVGIPIAIAAVMALFFELIMPLDLQAARRIDAGRQARISSITNARRNTRRSGSPTSLKGAWQLRAAQEALMKQDGPAMENLRGMLLDD
jgi:hypothetical protein